MQVLTVSSKQIWDRFINTYSPNALFQDWRWGDVLKSSTDVWRLGIYDDKKLVAVAQVALVKAKRGKFLQVRHGPIIPSLMQNKTNTAQKVLDLLLSYLKKLAKERRVWFIRVNPLIAPSTGNLTFFKQMGFVPSPIHAMDGEYCLVIDLQQDEETLYKSFRKTTRQEIRKAQKNGVVVTATKHQADFGSFMKLYEKTSQRQEFVMHKGLKQEFHVFSKDDKLTIYLALHNNTVLAGALIVYMNNQAIYHHGASIRSSVSGSHIIQWNAMLDAKKRGMSEYNMWGIAPANTANHPWLGLTRFKKGFGGETREFIHSHDLPVSFMYVIPKTVELIRKKRKGY